MSVAKAILATLGILLLSGASASELPTIVPDNLVGKLVGRWEGRYEITKEDQERLKIRNPGRASGRVTIVIRELKEDGTFSGTLNTEGPAVHHNRDWSFSGGKVTNENGKIVLTFSVSNLVFYRLEYVEERLVGIGTGSATVNVEFKKS